MIFNVLQNIEHVQDFSCMLAQNEDPLLRFMLKDPVSESVHSNMRKTSTIHSSTTTVYVIIGNPSIGMFQVILM